jgi:hypothetical protein
MPKKKILFTVFLFDTKPENFVQLQEGSAAAKKVPCQTVEEVIKAIRHH